MLVPADETDQIQAADETDQIQEQALKRKRSSKLKAVTEEQRRQAFEIIRVVSTMKVANSRAIRDKEVISNYEKDIIDQLDTASHEHRGEDYPDADNHEANGKSNEVNGYPEK